jgi:hypothetical protein
MISNYITLHLCCRYDCTLGGLLGFFPVAVFKRLRAIDASTLSAADADAEEVFEVLNAPSYAVRDAGESASAYSNRR